MKKQDLILLCALLAVGLITLGAFFLLFYGKGDTAIVTVDGEELMRLPLDQDTERLIETPYGWNRLVIRDGEVTVTDASCPDHICVKTGKADELKSIVCAPNHLTVTVEKN